MSSFDEVFTKVSRAGSIRGVVATLSSIQVNGVVGVAKAALEWGAFSNGPDDSDGGYLSAPTGCTGVARAGCNSSATAGGRDPTDRLCRSPHRGSALRPGPLRRDRAGDPSLQGHRPLPRRRGARDWGTRFTLEGATFLQDVFVSVGPSVGPDTGAGSAEQAVYCLTLKLVSAPA